LDPPRADPFGCMGVGVATLLSRGRFIFNRIFWLGWRPLFPGTRSSRAVGGASATDADGESGCRGVVADLSWRMEYRLCPDIPFGCI
jgi:hypothetical protein